MPYAFAEIAFTPSVRAQQDRLGSGNYANFLSAEREGDNRLSPVEQEFIEGRDGFYQATVSETGWPYVQFRGGPKGFLRVLDDRTIAYADLRGNRQYISLGNLSGNDRVSLILMDYQHARRLKIWGRVAFGDAPPASPPGVERLVLIRVEAFDWNCPRHIPRRLTDAEHGGEIESLSRRVRELEQQISELSGRQP